MAIKPPFGLECASNGVSIVPSLEANSVRSIQKPTNVLNAKKMQYSRK